MGEEREKRRPPIVKPKRTVEEIKAAIDSTCGNVDRAARALGVAPKTMHAYLTKHNLRQNATALRTRGGGKPTGHPSRGAADACAVRHGGKPSLPGSTPGDNEGG